MLLFKVTEKPVQEEKNYEQAETKTTKAKPTSSTVQKSAGNRRFGGAKTTNVKAPVQENQAQDIEEPASKPFKRPSRFALKQNKWTHITFNQPINHQKDIQDRRR